ncbi:MAG: rRNA maturation RNase YbeY [Clostridia bacterium]|nr:rRNA maturation RNase YbeY [Clostridia bacterium]
MTRIIIENEQNAVKISEEIENTIKKVIDASLEYENCDFDAEVSVTIVDNEAIREINNETRNIDAPTDVLSFPMLYFDENGDIIDSDFDMDGDVLVLGDIVISAERAKSQAEEFGHSFLREIAFLTVHSMLHLLGYDHVDDPEGEKIMFAKQEQILDKLGIKREV